MVRTFLAVILLCGSAFAAGTCTTGAIAQAAAGSTPVTISGCWYVDFTSGLDTNAGTTEGAPFLHAPGMQNCASSCASASVGANNGVIVKGGTTATNASLEWNLSSGTSGNPSYYGVDKTWFTGGSWTRPILTAGSTTISNNQNTMVSLAANVTFDSFEITGFFWSGASGQTCVGATYGNCGIFNAGQNSGQVWENLYIHGWTHAGTSSTYCSGNTCIVPNVFSLGGGGTSIVHDSVISGADVSGDHSMTAWFDGPPVAYNNVCIQMASCGIVSFATSYHDNLISNIGPAWCNTPSVTGCTHENGFEDNGDTGLLFYNNVISNVHAGLALWIAPYPTYTVSVWNNVMYGNDLGGDGNVIDLAPPVYNGSGTCPQGATGNNYCLAAGNYLLENNTFECGSDSQLYDNCQVGIGDIGSGSIANSVLYRNNHFITATGAAGTCYTGTGQPTSCTFATSNVVQSLTTANGQGYNSSQTYVFYPTSGGSTIGAGSNQTSGWPGANTNDTTYSCTDVSNVSTCPARTSNTRPSSGAWNSGAYEFVSSGQASAPSCTPTSGNVPQTVTCTDPNTPPTVACYNFTGGPTTAGDGVNCGGGSTKYTTALTISVAETLYVVAGTSTLSDSSEVSYTYTSGGGNTVGPPLNFIIVSQAPKIELQWEPSETQGVDYRIWRSVNGGEYENIKGGLTDTHWTDTEVERGTVYAYKSQAYLPPPCKKSCNSDFSDGVTLVCCQ
jgi:hypothetical protein